jgi:hypothetical protein
MPNTPFDGIFNGGQMTDLPAFASEGVFSGTDLMEIVSPGTAEGGVNYSITMLELAQYLIGLFDTATILEDEAAYASVATDQRILVKNSMALSTTITLLASSSYIVPILVKDIGGFASVANPITVNFTGGETIDGLSSVTITNPFGWMWFNPLEAGNFYAT